jgi:hypothetical protein
MPGLLEVPDGMAEADRRAMGTSQGTPTDPFSEPARRAPPSRRSEVFRGYPLDSMDRGSLERAAPKIWEPDDLLAAPFRLGRGRDVAQPVARLPGGFE